MVRALALVLTVFTGFTGLVYEVTWQKYLGTLLGSQSEATAAILGIFLGGLSVGYSVFGWVTAATIQRAERAGRRPRLLVLYGLVEAGIGLYALAFPWLFAGVQTLSFALPHGASGLGFAFDVALTALLIGPPTVLMGGTIPVLTQALARGLHDATRFHAFVYASNTAGAFAGALAAGFLLVPLLGLSGVLVAMGSTNLLAGAGFIALGLRTRGSDPSAAAALPAGAPIAAPGFAAWAAVALLSGFAMMAIQTVLNRVGALALGASQFTFSMVVAVFVLCIALGSFAVSALSRVRPAYFVASQWVLVGLLILLYFALPDAPYAAHVVRTLFRDEDAAFYPYHFTVFAAMLALLAIPIGISGATLPLIFHHLRGQAGDLGHVAGRLYSWNTIGSLLGALLGGYALLAVLDLHHVFRIAVAALAVGAAIVTARLVAPSAPARTLLPLLAAVGILVVLPPWQPEHLAIGLFRYRAPLPKSYSGPEEMARRLGTGMTVRFHDDDPINSVTVKEYSGFSSGLARSIVNNGKSDGMIPADYATMGLAALLPCLFAEHCERALVIGYGTGVTAGELAALPGTREVQVAEISRGVLDAAPLFDYGNQSASKSPKLRVVQSDAYRALRRSPDLFDVIVSEPSNPWVTGVEMLFSREFLEVARAHLTPGGVYAQWFHIYETDAETISIVLRTYSSVFDQVSAWTTMGSDMVILGFNRAEHALDIERLASRASEPAVVAALARAGVKNLPALLAREVLPLGVVTRGSLPGDIHTLLRPILSHHAAHAFFRGVSAEPPPTLLPDAARAGTENSLLRRYAARSGGTLSDEERLQVLDSLCPHRPTLCAALFAQWQFESPDSPALARALASARAPKTDLRKELQPELLDELAALFGRSGASVRPVSRQEASRATELFIRYYHHAAPFDRTVLARAWRRCTDADTTACSVGLAKAEETVGSLTGSGAATPSRP